MLSDLMYEYMQQPIYSQDCPKVRVDGFNQFSAKRGQDDECRKPNMRLT